MFFTAIAVADSNLAWGDSWGAATRQQAEQLALAQCAKLAADCKIVEWARYECLALAETKPGDQNWAWGADWGDDAPSAEAKALARCRSEGGTTCGVVVHPCSQD